MIRAAISRSACSARARRRTSSRDLAIASIRRAFWIAIAAWWASASTRATSSRLEGAGLRPADLEDAEEALLAGERRDDQRPDAVEADGLVEARVVLEARRRRGSPC